MVHFLGVPQIGLGGSGSNPNAIVTSESNTSWFTIPAGGSITANQFRAFVKDGGSSPGGIPTSAIELIPNSGGSSWSIF